MLSNSGHANKPTSQQRVGASSCCTAKARPHHDYGRHHTRPPTAPLSWWATVDGGLINLGGVVDGYWTTVRAALKSWPATARLSVLMLAIALPPLLVLILK